MYFMQCACSPVTSMSNFHSNVLKAVQEAWACSVSHFLRFLPVITLFLWSLHARLLTLAQHAFSFFINYFLYFSSIIFNYFKVN